MQILCDSTSIQEAVCSTTDPELKMLIQAHLERLSEYPDIDLGELLNIVIVETGDTVLELEAALGFPVMANRFEGTRFGDPDFLPSWEVIEAHHFWYELVYVLSDDGFGIVIFVPKDADPELIEMLQHYTPE